MVPLSLSEFMEAWDISGRIVKVTTEYTGEGEQFRSGQFELRLDGAVFKGNAVWLTKAKAPSVLELFNDLRSMALACDNAEDFMAWAKDLGYDEDSRAAEEMYDNRCIQTRKLERWLGTGRFRLLLWETKGL